MEWSGARLPFLPLSHQSFSLSTSKERWPSLTRFSGVMLVVVPPPPQLELFLYEVFMALPDASGVRPHVWPSNDHTATIFSISHPTLHVMRRRKAILSPGGTAILPSATGHGLELYLARSSVEITSCRVGGKCSCRPANIRFTRDVELPQRYWCRIEYFGVWRRLEWLESVFFFRSNLPLFSVISRMRQNSWCFYIDYNSGDCPFKIHAAIRSR